MLHRARKLREPKVVRVGREVHVKLLVLANRSYDALDEICRAAGITHQQYVALWALCLADEPERGVPIGAVSDGLLNRASDTTRLVDRLVRGGWAERVPNPIDRRSVLVRATPAGRRVFEQVTPELQQFHRREWSNLSATQIDALNALLGTALRDPAWARGGEDELPRKSQ
jgi:MarR family 2-MHQ and catechol resistance regulon transcriptional repressor